MNARQNELETLLRKATFSLESLESRVVDYQERLDDMKQRVVDQQEQVDRATRVLNQWINAPTKTKQQVMALATTMGVEVIDNGLHEGWYSIEIQAPYGSQFSESECQYMDYTYHESECTKNMLWHIVYDCMFGGLEEREEDDDE